MAPYLKAPITEAIIDLRVKLADGFNIDGLQEPRDAVRTGYPAMEKIFSASGRMAFGPDGGTASVEQRHLGWKLTSQDAKQVVQIRSEGFALSRLAPYESWEPFQSESRRLWAIYRESLQPEQVTRLAVRYINRIDIPQTEVELKDFFRTYPEIAPELPQQLDGFFVQLRIPYSGIHATCVVNQTIVPPSSPGVTSLVLDIDLSREVLVPQDDAEIWGVFELLRQTKDTVFESCITPACRKLFVPCPS